MVDTVKALEAKLAKAKASQSQNAAREAAKKELEKARAKVKALSPKRKSSVRKAK